MPRRYSLSERVGDRQSCANRRYVSGETQRMPDTSAASQGLPIHPRRTSCISGKGDMGEAMRSGGICSELAIRSASSSCDCGTGLLHMFTKARKRLHKFRPVDHPKPTSTHDAQYRPGWAHRGDPREGRPALTDHDPGSYGPCRPNADAASWASKGPRRVAQDTGSIGGSAPRGQRSIERPAASQRTQTSRIGPRLRRTEQREVVGARSSAAGFPSAGHHPRKPRAIRSLSRGIPSAMAPCPTPNGIPG